MRINPIAQNYYNNKNIQQNKMMASFQPTFEGPAPKQQQVSKFGKFGYYALAILAAPLIIVGMVGNAISNCITGCKE